ncbi:hypothetical protein STRIP9103_07672 [Streptomyces ipomoeae 91-03]|uniref:Uncharacterized protein n=1 Tax=Streptomyces ipomoeae 91-03 TaxID=698759 RepID=L1L3X8_9ACTN|nr:hypothetical protein STRIP9103_07672 [Streptomyces ipomoeae 91-03]
MRVDDDRVALSDRPPGLRGQSFRAVGTREQGEEAAVGGVDVEPDAMAFLQGQGLVDGVDGTEAGAASASGMVVIPTTRRPQTAVTGRPQTVVTRRCPPGPCLRRRAPGGAARTRWRFLLRGSIHCPRKPWSISVVIDFRPGENLIVDSHRRPSG